MLFHSKAIAGGLEFNEEVSFIGNVVDGSVGGAVYLTSSSEMLLHNRTHIQFINNTGRYIMYYCSDC